MFIYLLGGILWVFRPMHPNNSSCWLWGLVKYDRSDGTVVSDKAITDEQRAEAVIWLQQQGARRILDMPPTGPHAPRITWHPV